MKESARESLVSKINDVLAMRITMVVGSIWAFYAFVIFGLTPVLWPQYETQILYWSNFLQLIFLPVITVGTAIMNRDSELRAKQDHETIQLEFRMLQETHRCIDKSLARINDVVHELLARSGDGQTAALAAMAAEGRAPSKKAKASGS